MNKKMEEVHKQICTLIEKAPQEMQNRWNFITDIDTNDIRDGCEEEALDLLLDLKLCDLK